MSGRSRRWTPATATGSWARSPGLASFFKASEEDLEWLDPGRGVEVTLKAWAANGPQFGIVTLGGEGALAYLGGERIAVAPRRVEVVDTVGAGDSFMSSLLFAMDRDGALGAGAPAPSLEKLARWTDFAARASATRVEPAATLIAAMKCLREASMELSPSVVFPRSRFDFSPPIVGASGYDNRLIIGCRLRYRAHFNL